MDSLFSLSSTIFYTFSGKSEVYSYISTNMLSDSTVTLYDAKSLILAGNLSNFPVLQSNLAPCHPHVTTHPSKVPSERLEPEWHGPGLARSLNRATRRGPNDPLQTRPVPNVRKIEGHVFGGVFCLRPMIQQLVHVMPHAGSRRAQCAIIEHHRKSSERVHKLETIRLQRF